MLLNNYYLNTLIFITVKYLKLGKYCNFGTKKRAWRIIPAQEVNK